METIKIMCESVGVLIALVTVWQAWLAYNSHKDTEHNKLLSQLNKRYENNDTMQAVVKYLRDKEPIGDKPSLYQVEVFLRFFEELGLYMRTGSIKARDVDTFFGYYLKQLYTTTKGKALLEQLGEEEKQLALLQIVKQNLNIK